MSGIVSSLSVHGKSFPSSLLFFFLFSPLLFCLSLCFCVCESGEIWNGEVIAPVSEVCVCFREMDEETKTKQGGGLCFGISMLRVSALDVPLSPSPSLSHPSFSLFLSCLSLSLVSVHSNYAIKTLQPKRIIAS